MPPATPDKHVKTYRARSGAEQFKPSLELAVEMDSDLQGFCLACGSIEVLIPFKSGHQSGQRTAMLHGLKQS